MAIINKGDCVGIVYWNGNKWIVHDGVLVSPKTIKSGRNTKKTMVTIRHYNDPKKKPENLHSTPYLILKTSAELHETAINCAAIKNPSIKAGKCVAVTFKTNSNTDIKNGVLLCDINSPNTAGTVWINHWKFPSGFNTSQSKPPKKMVEESKKYTSAKVKEVKI
ncbi:hypothetical protein [Niallia oryzisoli]|uniref:hypothetical protein n=1 Tax=Niallia oryzisoli TaxID=1737571 RepID=UPI003736240A